MKKLLSVMAVFLVAAVLAFPPTAHATITLRLSDGINPVVQVADGDAADLNPLPGFITIFASIGVWNSNVSTGYSNSPGAGGLASMDLNSQDNSTGAGTLTLMVSDIGFALPGTNIGSMNIGGTIGAVVGNQLTYAAYFDNANGLFATPGGGSLGTLGPFGPGAFSGTTSGTGIMDNEFSLTEVVTIHHSGAGLTSFNAELNVVPLPPTALLLGGGLLGLVALGWRRRRS